jgi:single-strand DNA-binding protein
MLKIQAIGHLGNDATVNLVNNKNVINFNLAHTEKYKNAEGNETIKTTWLSCAYWAERVVVAKYLKKGTQVFIEGRPESKVYTNKDGESIPQLHVRVISIELLNSVKTQGTTDIKTNNSSEKVDDLPF